MAPRTRSSFVFAALLLCAAAAAVAAAPSYVGNIPLPADHAFILPTNGVPSQGYGAEYYLVTLQKVYELDRSTPAFAEYNLIPGTAPLNALSPVSFEGFEAIGDRLFAVAIGGKLLVVPISNLTDPRVEQLTVGNAGTTDLANRDGLLAFLTGFQVHVVDPETGASTHLLTSGSGTSQLVSPGSIAFGPDGLLYVLDAPAGGYRVQAFDVTTADLSEADRLQHGFPVTATLANATSGLLVSPSGRVYVADGTGGGAAYTLHGDLLGTFTYPGEPTPDTGNGSPFLNGDRGGNLFVYTPATGLHQYFDASFLPGYWSVTPCRVVDTRADDGPVGGPTPSSGIGRSFVLAGACGIPADATAVAVNVTVTGATGDGNVDVFPAGMTPPVTSVVNFRAGQTRANNAVVSLSAEGAITLLPAVSGGGEVDVIVDVAGYFTGSTF